MISTRQIRNKFAVFFILAGLAGIASAEILCIDESNTGFSEKELVRIGCKKNKTESMAKKSEASAPSATGLKSSNAVVPPGAQPAKPNLAQKLVTAPGQKRWEIRPADVTINGALQRWATEEGWQLSWEISQTFPVTLTANFDKTFVDAVDEVIEAFANSDYPLKGCFYDNKVLRVVRRVGDGKECFAPSRGY